MLVIVIDGDGRGNDEVATPVREADGEGCRVTVPGEPTGDPWREVRGARGDVEGLAAGDLLGDLVGLAANRDHTVAGNGLDPSTW